MRLRMAATAAVTTCLTVAAVLVVWWRGRRPVLVLVEWLVLVFLGLVAAAVQHPLLVQAKQALLAEFTVAAAVGVVLRGTAAPPGLAVLAPLVWC
jgi:hypothetical protein